MRFQHFHLVLLSALCIMLSNADGLACNWGTRSTHPLPPNIVVRLLKDNGFDKVKLFEAEPGPLKALGNSGIQVMVGIPNDLLASLATDANAAAAWVSQNVSSYISRNRVDIRYVAVGNEPFLKSYNGRFVNSTFPALQNIQAALITAGLARQVKATIPLNADVYQSDSGLPSGGNFRPDIHDLMISIIKFLHQNGSPISINIYPFLSLDADPNFPKEFAFFDGSAPPVVDGSVTYTNVLDANFDTLVAALEKNGFGSMPVMIGEVGWPTDGSSNANLRNAQRFNQGLVDRIVKREGSPRRAAPPDIYVFALLDEDAKSVDPGNFERHWGMFNYDGSVKYPVRLGNGKALVGAKGVRYLPKRWCVVSPQAAVSDPNSLGQSINEACARADCTSLAPGSSCAGLDPRTNASYAFNSYYQTMNQSRDACQFHNMAIITNVDPSPPQSSCRFKIMIDTRKRAANRTIPTTPSSPSVAAPVDRPLLLLVSSFILLIIYC